MAIQNCDFEPNSSQALGTRKRSLCVTCLRTSSHQICSNCVNSDSFKSALSRLLGVQQNQAAICSKAINSLNSGTTATFSALQSTQQTSSGIIAITKGRVSMKSDELRKKSEKLAYMRRRRKDYELSVRHLQHGLEPWENAIRSKEERLKKKRDLLAKRRSSLKKLRIKLAADEITTIFPLGLVYSEDFRSGDEAIVDALTEATMTTFRNGRWVFSTPGSHSFKIGNSRVPDFSDYRDLKEWLYRKKQADFRIPPDITALNTMAGLADIIHLISILARIYDVILLFPAYFKKFVTMEKITEDKMDTMLLQLNANVCVLCFSQGMEDVSLPLNRPFCNLLTLSQNLVASGSTLSFELPSVFVQEFGSSAEKIKWTECDLTVLGNQHRSEESEWEEISQELPAWSETPVHSSTITSLITSATTSVTHLFRAN